MALIKPEQLQSGSYSITGSFSGSFYGDGSNLNNLPVPSIDTGSLVTTSSFNSFTSSYYADSGSFSTRVTNLENFSSSLDATFATEAELNAATSSLSASISYLSSSFEIFSGSYNTGSFTGSFIGDLTGTASYADSASYALTASYLDNYIPPFPYTGSAEITGSLSVTGSTSLYDSGSTILSINGSQGEIFSISDDLTGDLLVVQSGSTDLFIVSSSGATTISGSLTVTGSTNLYNSGSTVLSVNGFQGEIFSITDDFTGDLFIVQSGSTDLFVVSASGDTTISGSLIVNGPQGEIFSISDDLTGDLFTIQSGSTDLFIVSSSGDTTISGSLVVTNSITSSLYGTSSWAENSLTASYISASNIDGTVLSSSYAESGSYTLSASYAESGSYALSASHATSLASGLTITASNILVTNTASILYLLVVTSSVAFTSGSNIIGSNPGNTQTLWGTIDLKSGPLLISGSTNASGSITAQSFIGPLIGTASWANNALTSSYSNLTVNSTPIGGAVNNGEILYRNGGVLSTSTNLAFNATLGRLSVGQGLSPGARLDIKAQGSASSDSVLRVRNNGNTFDILTLTGNNILSLSGSSNITGSLNVNNLLYTSGSNIGIGNVSANSAYNTYFSGSTNVSNSIDVGPFGYGGHNLSVRGYTSVGSVSTNGYGAIGSNYYIDNTNILRTRYNDRVSALEFPSGGFLFRTGIAALPNTSVTLINLMYLDRLGTLGLGPNPQTLNSALLHISGANSAALLKIDSPSTPSILFVTGSGRIGIGTATPNARLDVSGSAIITGSLTNQPVTLTATSGTASMNCTQGNFFNLTLSSSSTIHLSSSNIQPGQTINLRITQPATSGSLTYGSQFKFAGGIPYSASATGSVVDIVSFISFDSTTLYGSAIKNLS